MYIDYTPPLKLLLESDVLSFIFHIFDILLHNLVSSADLCNIIVIVVSKGSVVSFLCIQLVLDKQSQEFINKVQKRHLTYTHLVTSRCTIILVMEWQLL